MRTIGTKRHKRLIELLIAERKTHGIRQEALARALGENQSWVARIESGQRRVDVIEFLRLADVIGFDAQAMIAEIQAAEPVRRKRR